MSTARLIELVETLPAARVVLVGDYMVDRYLYGNAERLSPEAPVPVLHFQKEELRLGGAGSVAANLAALGARVAAVGVIGLDETGQHLASLLRDLNADPTGLLELPRPTTCKMRLVGSAQHRHPQQMIRLDFEEARPVDAAAAQQLVDSATVAMSDADLVCIEDYDKGAVTADVCRGVIAAARARGTPVLVDPARIPDYGKYTGATCLKLNRPEAARATGLPLDTPDQYAAAADQLLRTLRLQAVVITLDKHGAYVATASSATTAGDHRLIGTRPRQVYDVTGAGDMAFAMLAVARCGGATWDEATTLANAAGGLEVERFGVVPITAPEVAAELRAAAHLRPPKQTTLDALLPVLEQARRQGLRIVFTNGCFDLIHAGHVGYFRFSKSQGDLLVVAVNTDASVQRLKGPTRPITPQDDRLAVLEELESIDHLLLFDTDTPLSLIEAVRPDVLVKGADYARDGVVGGDFVERHGGTVALAPLAAGRSTSNVITRILAAHAEPPAIGV